MKVQGCEGVAAGWQLGVAMTHVSASLAPEPLISGPQAPARRIPHAGRGLRGLRGCFQEARLSPETRMWP